MKGCLPMLLLLALPAFVSGRLMYGWSYEEMFEQADLVVIAKPVATKETAETNTLPDIRPDIKVIGLATEFEVRTVMKGNVTNRFVLHHYRFAETHEAMPMDPHLVSFDAAKQNCFLLLLTRESDGRYAPVSGQTDPGVFSVLKLEGFAR